MERDSGTVETKLQSITKTIRENLDRYALAQCRKKKKSKDSWITKLVLSALNKRKFAYQRWNNLPNQKTGANSADFIMRQVENSNAKNNFFRNQLGATPAPKRNFDVYNQIARNKYATECLQVLKNQLLNDYFTYIGPNLAKNSTTARDQGSMGTEIYMLLHFGPLDFSQEVMKTINKMRNKSSYAHDQLSNKMTKLCGPVTSRYLSDIFNRIIETETFLKTGIYRKLFRYTSQAVLTKQRTIDQVSALRNQKKIWKNPKEWSNLIPNSLSYPQNSLVFTENWVT